MDTPEQQKIVMTVRQLALRAVCAKKVIGDIVKYLRTLEDTGLIPGCTKTKEFIGAAAYVEAATDDTIVDPLAKLFGLEL